MESERNFPRAASDMLADALQQFDSILGSGPADISAGGEFVGDGLQGIGQLLDDLRITIQAEQMTIEERGKLLSLLPPETLLFYQDLFKTSASVASTDAQNLQKMKNENESLSLQVSVLTDQVELQMEKIEELTEVNIDLQNKLLSTEERLQKQVQINAEWEREATMFKERLRLQTKSVKDAASGTCDTYTVVGPHADSLEQKLRLVSPDEGIVRDSYEVVKPALKMPEPTATSTPISVVVSSLPRHTVKFENDVPQNDEIATPKRVQNERFMSVSLERLHGKRIAAVSATDAIKKSSSQSENLNKSTVEDTTDLKVNTNQSDNTKSCSSPNLAMTDAPNKDGVDHGNIIDVETNHHEGVEESLFHNRKKHSFKKFFSSFKLRRSNSSNLQGSEVTSLQSWGGKGVKTSSVKISRNPDAFTRGGFRATAGPRLERTKPKVASVNTKPFAQWTTEDVADWMVDLGLDAYIENCRGWVKSGSTLLQATNQDIEKELGVHNPLHKKKLMLSLQALGDEDEVEGQAIKGPGMDSITVARWLDDIGLPQFKDAFHKARIDYRMLHHLTIGDLQRLKITNLLNVLSFRRAIYTLRKLNFDPMQLKRRPVDTEIEAEQVYLWTNHRVMEWLRSIDLAEYAPNLRGSGVHGSLMVFEPQFTGEIFASLLHIPASKSLLRRHLVSKFNEIIPTEFMTQKQKEASLSAINIMAKVKIGRRSFGPLSRLRVLGGGGGAFREFSSGEYVCPFETKNSAVHQSLSDHRRVLGAKIQSHELKNQRTWDADAHDVSGDSASDDSGNIKIVELDESATKKIGAFSAELATMTNKWSED